MVRARAACSCHLPGAIRRVFGCWPGWVLASVLGCLGLAGPRSSRWLRHSSSRRWRRLRGFREQCCCCRFRSACWPRRARPSLPPTCSTTWSPPPGLGVRLNSRAVGVNSRAQHGDSPMTIPGLKVDLGRRHEPTPAAGAVAGAHVAGQLVSGAAGDHAIPGRRGVEGISLWAGLAPALSRRLQVAGPL